MVIVHGKIGSLKQVRASLNKNRIHRFNSIGDIRSFIEGFDLEWKDVIEKAENDIDFEIQALTEKTAEYEKNYNDRTNSVTKRLDDKINALTKRKDFLIAKNQNNIIWVWDMLRAYILKFRLYWLKKRYDKVILKKTLSALQQLQVSSKNLDYHTSNKAELIRKRSLPKTNELARTKEVVDRLYPVITGAIGESRVEKELKQLSDNVVLFNDFTMKFNKPIYNRKKNDRIMSIQVDHLLVTNSGLFIIETKNWSKKSIESLSLRSPVDQIKRNSYALFVIMNSRSNGSNFKLNKHHWGEKEVPIRNLIVMINNKPREKFKYVQVKTLKELNNYINYFDPVFDDSEVSEITDYLDSVRF